MSNGLELINHNGNGTWMSDVVIDCLNSSEYDRLASDDAYAYATDNASEDGSDYDSDYRRRDQVLEHPCQALKKLLSDGTFYFSSDFDVTSRLQDRYVMLLKLSN